ncbi:MULTISPECIES: DUF1654 domain-containing protein [Salinicola]|uniref:DUF1654 domain-containing protein n=1 Tax=Salinicola socius TaxID=404433 RepID=A0A1Q8SVU2_9GAMM|nr:MULTISPECIES: DUF1654 domain-containing protein [Salinicola]OLO05546.1 hypothetical protein BTW07_03470 [Salinicola socius]
MVIPFPTPEARLTRRVEKLIAKAQANHRHQVTISRRELEPVSVWENLVEQFDDSEGVRVIHITRHDILLNWCSPTSGLAS